MARAIVRGADPEWIRRVLSFSIVPDAIYYLRIEVAAIDRANPAKLKALEQENRELKRANEILKRAASFFGAELDRQSKR